MQPVIQTITYDMGDNCCCSHSRGKTKKERKKERKKYNGISKKHFPSRFIPQTSELFGKQGI